MSIRLSDAARTACGLRNWRAALGENGQQRPSSSL